MKQKTILFLLTLLFSSVVMAQTAEECYKKGSDYYLKDNYTEALRWYRKSADQGYDEAYMMLGHMYKSGHGVSKNETEAVNYYRKAAEKGYLPAQNEMGICYELGKGVTKNMTEAKKWYQKAADGGNENAKKALERLNAPASASTTTATTKKVYTYGSYKFGHINLNQLFEAMPEHATYMNELEQFAADYKKEFEQMENEYQAKLNDYNAMQGKLDKSTLDKRRDELEQLQNRINNYAELANKEIERASNDKLEPIMEKIKKAVKSVGQKNGYIFIFRKIEGEENADSFINSLMTTDVMQLVKKELGI